MNIKLSCYLLIIIFFSSCEGIDLPKPNAYLSLDFPDPNYSKIKFDNTNVSLEINSSKTSLLDNISESNSELFLSKTLSYPFIKADIFLAYFKLNKSNNLNYRLKYLSDFTAIHLKKSLSPPSVQEFVNEKTKVFASIINIKGDITSPYQFYATDSTNNLIIGILNFKSNTKYDSVLPALNYLKNDIYHLIESLNWNVDK